MKKRIKSRIKHHLSLLSSAMLMAQVMQIWNSTLVVDRGEVSTDYQRRITAILKQMYRIGGHKYKQII
jgi:hypothetical protein